MEKVQIADCKVALVPATDTKAAHYAVTGIEIPVTALALNNNFYWSGSKLVTIGDTPVDVPSPKGGTHAKGFTLIFACGATSYEKSRTAQAAKTAPVDPLIAKLASVAKGLPADRQAEAMAYLESLMSAPPAGV